VVGGRSPGGADLKAIAARTCASEAGLALSEMKWLNAGALAALIEKRNCSSVGFRAGSSQRRARQVTHPGGGSSNLSGRATSVQSWRTKTCRFALDAATSVRRRTLFDPMMRTSFASISMRWANARRWSRRDSHSRYINP